MPVVASNTTQMKNMINACVNIKIDIDASQ